MENQVLVAIPLNAYSEWLDDFEMFTTCDYMVFDNSNDRRIKSACQYRGINYVKSASVLGRHESWIECFRVASTFGHEWVKPLFHGDILRNGFPEELRRNSTDIVLFRYMISHKWLKRFGGQKKTSFSPILNTAIFGPWSGPPLAIAFKSRAFLESVTKEVPVMGMWTSDFSVVYHILHSGTYTFSNCIVGEFNSKKRETWSLLKISEGAFKEEVQWMNFARLKLPDPKMKLYRSYLQVIYLGLRRGLLVPTLCGLRTIRNSSKRG